MVVGCGGDDDMQMDHSNFTATSTKLPYKTSNLPNKDTKKCCGPPRFSDLSTLFVPLMQTSILTSEIAFSSTMFANVWSTWFCQISEFAQIEQKMVS